YAALFAKEHATGRVNPADAEAAVRAALEPFDRTGAEGPYQVQQDLQEMMQDLVGIVRRQEEMERALDGLARFRDRAAKVGVIGNREFNPGWHTALDLHNLLVVSEAVTRTAIERRESRGAHFRDDFPDKDPAVGKVNIVLKKGPGGAMQLRREPLRELPAELKHVIEEMK